MPYALALVSCLLFGISEFLYKVAHEGGLHEATFLCVQSGIVFCALGFISAGGAGWQLTPATVGLGIGCGLAAFGAAVTLLVAMGRGPASVTAAVRRLGFILTGALAIAFLGERLTVAKLAGIGLAVSGLLTMAWAPTESHRPHRLVYLTAVASGVLAFGHKLGALAGVSPSAFLMLQAGTVHLGAHAWCHRTGGYHFGRGTRIAPMTGLFIAAAMTLFLYALRHGDATVLVPLVQMSFLVTAPLSFRLLREPAAPRKLIGLALGTAAVLVFGLAA